MAKKRHRKTLKQRRRGKKCRNGFRKGSDRCRKHPRRRKKK